MSQLIRSCGLKTASIDELAELVSKRLQVPQEFTDSATLACIKKVVRRQIKTIKDGDGLSQFESIERLSEDGSRERVYANLSLFDPNDYRSTINYYAERCRYHGRKANRLTSRCNAQHNTNLALPFPGFGIIADAEEE